MPNACEVPLPPKAAFEDATPTSLSLPESSKMGDHSSLSNPPRLLQRLSSAFTDPGSLINRSSEDECLGTWSATGILVNFISVGYILNPSGKVHAVNGFIFVE